MNKPTNQFECIYLTLYDPQCEDEGPVWWCEDRTDDSDIEYVNVAALGAQAERIAELEYSVNLYHRCYEAAREIWRKNHPDRAKWYDPSGEKAIAEMIADHSFWEKHSLTGLCERNTELKERIAELEAAVHTALNWRGLDGDGIHQPVLDQLRRAMGLPVLEAHDDLPTP